MMQCGIVENIVATFIHIGTDFQKIILSYGIAILPGWVECDGLKVEGFWLTPNVWFETRLEPAPAILADELILESSH